MSIILFIFTLVVIVTIAFVFLRRISSKTAKTDQTQEVKSGAGSFNVEAISNSWKHLIDECEEKLSPEHRNKVKLVFERDDPEMPTALKIGHLKVNIKRYGKLSLFDLSANPLEALYFARDGHHGTGRYIPIPEELEYILAHREILNVYFEALNLPKLEEEDHFWCVDTSADWNTGWKRFEWDVVMAMEQLGHKFRVRTSSRHYRTCPPMGLAYTFSLLKGWDYLFVEI